MRNNTLLYLCCLLALSLSACKKLIEVDTPENELPAEDVWNNDTLSDAAVADIYYVLGGYFSNNILTLINGMTSDELITLNTAHRRYVNNAIPADDALILTTWRELYKAIYRANTVIEGAKSSHLIGEAKFLRAFTYYYLVNNWGEVPLILTTNVKETALASRASISAIYLQMLTDLQEAKELLPENYPTGEKVRANKWAAAAMLAKVNLLTQDWEAAILNTTAVLNTGSYLPLMPLDSVFLKNSRAAILQIWMKDGYTFPGQTFLPVNTSSFSFYPLTDNMMNGFEAGDTRKTAWTATFTYAGTQYYYPAKYKRRNVTTGDTAEHLMVLRISEQYLIRAEARCELDDISGAVADLNVVRQHARLTPLSSGIGKAACLLAIEKERRSEFFTEWGDRWITLKRSGRVNMVLSQVKSNWKSTAALYPIPQQERDRDVNLTQNTGY